MVLIFYFCSIQESFQNPQLYQLSTRLLKSLVFWNNRKHLSTPWMHLLSGLGRLPLWGGTWTCNQRGSTELHGCTGRDTTPEWKPTKKCEEKRLVNHSSGINRLDPNRWHLQSAPWGRKVQVNHLPLSTSIGLHVSYNTHLLKIWHECISTKRVGNTHLDSVMM